MYKYKFTTLSTIWYKFLKLRFCFLFGLFLNRNSYIEFPLNLYKRLVCAPFRIIFYNLHKFTNNFSTFDSIGSAFIDTLQFLYFYIYGRERENEQKKSHNLFFILNFQSKDYSTSDLQEIIKFSVDLLPNDPLSGFITDTWSRDTIPWEMSIVVSCGALFWWKYLSEWRRYK